MDEIDEDVEDIVEESPRPLSSDAAQRQKERREATRILVELNHVIKCLKITREIQSICDELHEGFFAFAYRALVSDAVSSLIRVVVSNSRSFSFWTIRSRFPRTVQIVCTNEHINLDRIRQLAERLRTARNKLQFHIDRGHAANPDDLWKELDITHQEMSDAAKDLANVVSSVLTQQYTFPANLSRYEAEDVRPILECLRDSGLGNFTTRQV